MSAYATSTQDKIDQAEKDKDELEGKLDDKKDELGNLQDEHKDLSWQLKKLNEELTAISENLTSLEEQITAKQEEIDVTQANLEEARSRESKQYSSMKIRIRYMFENYGKNYLAAIFSSKTLADLISITDFFEAIAADDREKLEQYEANRAYIESEEARLWQEKADLDTLKALAESERNRVFGLVEETAKNVSQYADQIEAAEAEAKRYEAQLKEKEKDLAYLKKVLAAELALAQAAANAKWRDISEVTFAEGDLKLLANLIYCEAGGEPYEGQVAVGAVVINRVLSSKFPDTVVGVIYQKRQFSPVGSGRLELALSVDKATKSCYKAAQEAMAGLTNVDNCLFFRTPIPGLLPKYTIGGHVFY